MGNILAVWWILLCVGIPETAIENTDHGSGKLYSDICERTGR